MRPPCMTFSARRTAPGRWSSTNSIRMAKNHRPQPNGGSATSAFGGSDGTRAPLLRSARSRTRRHRNRIPDRSGDAHRLDRDQNSNRVRRGDGGPCSNPGAPAPPPSPKFERWLYAFCGKGTTPLKERLPGNDLLAGWLRLQLKDGAGTATMTFADPGGQKTDNVPAPLVLLALGKKSPDEKPIWKQGLSDDVVATVSTPRVGYLDFERWFANRGLYKKTFKTEPEAADSEAARFMYALLTAYVMRHFRLAATRNSDRPAARSGGRGRTAGVDRTRSAHRPGSRRSQHGGHRPCRKAAAFADASAAEAKSWTLTALLGDVLEPLDRLFQFTVRLAPGTGFEPDPQSGATDLRSIGSRRRRRQAVDRCVSAGATLPAGRRASGGVP